MAHHTINPGLLRQTLYLQESTDSYGNPGTWANVATDPTIRCAMRTLSGAEPVGAAGERGQRQIEVTMRYRSDVTYATRFSDGASPDRVFDIVHIQNVNEMDHKLIVICTERTQHNG